VPPIHESHNPKKILAAFPGPVVLLPEKQTWLIMSGGLGFVGAVCALLAIWRTFADGSITGSAIVCGLLAMLLFGFAALGLWSLTTGRMGMKLDDAGFETVDMWGIRRFRSWRDVHGFRPVVARYIEYVTYAGGPPARWWHLNRITYFGGNEWLPDTYGFSGASLASLLTKWRERALAQSPSGAPYGSSSVSQ